MSKILGIMLPDETRQERSAVYVVYPRLRCDLDDRMKELEEAGQRLA